LATLSSFRPFSSWREERNATVKQIWTPRTTKKTRSWGRRLLQHGLLGDGAGVRGNLDEVLDVRERAPAPHLCTNQEIRNHGLATQQTIQEEISPGRRPHPPRTPGAGFPAAGLLFSSAALAAIVPDTDLHTAHGGGSGFDSRNAHRSPWRERSAAIREAHPQEEEEEETETDRPACRSSRDAAAVPYGRRSPGMTRKECPQPRSPAQP